MNQEQVRLNLYNTETLQKEEILPIDGKVVRFYVCGPTVYDFAHIGNFRTYVFSDLIRRTLHYLGLSVEQVMNITDVEDKIIHGALREKKSLQDFTAVYEKAFYEDLKTLCIKPAEHYPHATDYLPQMIAMIEKLIEEGFAYQSEEGSIYYSTQRFPSYGRLSHLPLQDLQEGASQSVDSQERLKQASSDFVLWKAYDPERDGSIYWDSPFGKGRPGWHIECSAMALSLLGKTLDLHVGGIDLVFPHHENELAQSEAFSKQRFVAHWAHCEHLLVDQRKMSKSLGNFYTLRDLLAKGYSGSEVRYLLLQTHYRTQLNFTFQGLDAARAALQRLSDFLLRLEEIREEKNLGIVDPLLHESQKAFTHALADDLNIASALAVLFDLVRVVNALCDEGKIGQMEACQVIALLRQFDAVLGILPGQVKVETISPELEEAIAKREQARREKQWKTADQWRDWILERGFIVEDTPSGPRLKKIAIHN